MTTSVTLLVHGRPIASLYTQPAATVLGLLAAMVCCGSAYVAASGRPAYRVLRPQRTSGWLVPLLVTLIGGGA